MSCRMEMYIYALSIYYIMISNQEIRLKWSDLIDVLDTIAEETGIRSVKIKSELDDFIKEAMLSNNKG